MGPGQFDFQTIPLNPYDEMDEIYISPMPARWLKNDEKAEPGLG